MKKMIAPCGIDCCQCSLFIATKNNSKAEAIKAAKQWADKFDEDKVWCDGCLVDGRKWQHCAECEIREKSLGGL